MLDQKMPMAFSPDAHYLPEGILILDSLVLVKSGAANKMSDLVANETSHNIQLNKNT